MEERWYAIAYDITDDRRRTIVSRWLEGWGDRVQRSVFEAELRPAEYQRLRTGLLQRIEPTVDAVRIYQLGARGFRLIDAVTGPPPRPRERFIIV